MKPKEKAKDLFDKMNRNVTHALIAVDEILKVCWMYDECESYDWKYWQEVKKEINKL